MHADGTTIHRVSKTIEVVITILNVAASELRPLCTKSHLVVHTGTSEVMIY